VKLRLLFLGACLLATGGLPAAERIPPAPPRYFNDYAGIVRPATADALNRQLEQAERDTSNQLLVAIYPRMESDSSVEDYTVRVAQAWKAGQQGRNNGAVLFAFMQSHDLYLQVGYGLEGAIPDAIAKRIIEREIVPRFRAGDMDGGMTAAVTAMIAASKGEYKGTGRTAAERQPASRGTATGFVVVLGALCLFFLVIVLVVRRILRIARNPLVLVNPRRRGGLAGTPWWMGDGGNSGGSSWGGGGSFGGGGGFSGGGGSFGGGGAGGKW
jgi:uncharacterized protein